MKQTSADGSVASAHVRVGHRQALNTLKTPVPKVLGFFIGRWNLLRASACIVTPVNFVFFIVVVFNRALVLIYLSGDVE